MQHPQYQRYKLVSDIINKFRIGEKKFKILDVGAGFEANLKKFLPLDNIFFLDKEYQLEFSHKEDFIARDILKMELKEKYDFVVAVDVYEHILDIDRKKFIDIIITLSDIATIIAAPFDQDEVRNCEFFANYVYRHSHDLDYIWLNEHIKNGLPSLPSTVELIKDHHLNFVIVPNGYLPRWFEMISIYLLMEGKPEFQKMIATLNEFYNRNYYQYDNRNPAYRQIIIIPKEDLKIEILDLVAENINHNEIFDKNELLRSFIEKINQAYQINKEVQNQAIIAKDTHFKKMITCIHSMEQTQTIKDSQLHDITNEAASLNRVITEKDNQLHEMSQKIFLSDNFVYSLMSQLNDTNSLKDSLEIEIVQIKNSISYQCLMKFHKKIIQSVLPQTTRRREIYDLGLKSGRILINEGVGKLFWHYNERKTVKKTEKELIRINNNRNNDSSDEKGVSCKNSIDLRFPKSETDVEVSIIIPVFNKFQYTLNCLKSISDNTEGSFEVVIVDDASTDGTTNQLKIIPNLEIIRNKKNLGFVESCNIGAKFSKGKFLLFLNNDTIVTENWLPPLLDLIKKENVAAVGSKLIYPNGVLQEAGGIIWNDASGWNYGRGDNPEKSQYNYVRDVDYCSGAALLVKNDILKKVCGFDLQFKPGYYEDTDLCFAVRELGYRVLYQPLSVVIHFEGISNGTDLSTGVKKYQEINKIKFFKKWENRLNEQYYAANSDNLFDARIRKNGKKILVIDHYVPTWDMDAGAFRMYNLLKILVDLNHKVTFIGDNLLKLESYTTDLQQNGIEVIYYPSVPSINEYLKDYGCFYDIVIISRSHIALKHYFNIKKYCTNAKIIFDTVDLQYIRERRRAEIENDATVLKEAENSKVTELFLVSHCDLTFVVSPNEKEFLLEEDPQFNIEILSLIHEISPCTTAFYNRKDLMFVGGFNHPPNVDAMKWFSNEIFPHIIKSIPDIKLFIIGNGMTKEDEFIISSNNIIVVGYVKDLTSYFNNCRVFVAPLRYGAGVKGKINQSMSYGLPVVTTSIGAEGMYLIDGENALIGDNTEIFANKCIELYQNERLWTELSKNSIANINDHFSYTKWKKEIPLILENLLKK